MFLLNHNVSIYNDNLIVVNQNYSTPGIYKIFMRAVDTCKIAVFRDIDYNLRGKVGA